MRPAVLLAAGALWFLVLPARADAAPIQRAFDAVLAVYSSTLPPVYFTGAGVARVEVSGDHATGLTLPAGAFSTVFTTTAPGVEIRVNAANATGSFASSAGSWTGVMPLSGTLRICLVGGCDGTPLVDVLLPLGVIGVGGTTQTPSANIQVVGAPWQTGPLTLSGPGFVSIFSGYQAGPGRLTSSTALPGGSLLFLTPAFVTIDDPGGIDFVVELAVTFVPEPGLLVLLASGVLALATLRRSRRC